jgi:hypothetical protein
MVKKAFYLFLLYVFLLTVNLVIARAIIQKNHKITFYRAIMNDLTEIGSALALETSDPADQALILKEYATNDIRVANLKYFFRKYNSVLYDYAEVFVKWADEYQFDYRLLPAIAMQESNLCKYIYEGSHNCWGWGIYGNKVTRFSSYDEAIETISRGIKKYYIDEGLTTPEQIMNKYTPPSTGSWAHGVNTFLKAIE